MSLEDSFRNHISDQCHIIVEKLKHLSNRIEYIAEKVEEIENIVEKRIFTERRKSITITEAADIFGKSRRTIERWVEEGKLEIVPQSKPLRVTVSSVKKLRDGQ